MQRVRSPIGPPSASSCAPLSTASASDCRSCTSTPDSESTTNERVVSLKGRLDAPTNLAVQTRIVAGARLFVGTCGSLAWLAPLVGVPTVPVFTDASFLHAHLHVARRVYGRIGAAPFSPVDLTGIIDAGLAIGPANQLVAGGHPS
jgi:ADP-heptose:LPS heptosyltransferase